MRTDFSHGEEIFYDRGFLLVLFAFVCVCEWKDGILVTMTKFKESYKPIHTEMMREYVIKLTFSNSFFFRRCRLCLSLNLVCMYFSHRVIQNSVIFMSFQLVCTWISTIVQYTHTHTRLISLTSLHASLASSMSFLSHSSNSMKWMPIIPKGNK